MISIENIITLWQNLLLEKKIFLLSKSKVALTHVSLALIGLLFPLKWMHVFIPVLPEKLKIFSDAPVPLLIGICYDIIIKDVPEDIIVFDVDKNSFIQYNEQIVDEPTKLMQQLRKRLEKFNKKYDNPVDKKNVRQLEVLFKNRLSYEANDIEPLNASEVRDIFYEFFINLLKNYEAYVGNSKEITFNFDQFLRDHNSDTGSFLSLLCETNVFLVFIDSFMDIEKNESLQFFLEYYYVVNFQFCQG